MASKPCRSCGASERYKSGACAPCARARSTAKRLADPEASRAAVKKYYYANRDKQLAYLKRYHAANRERALEYSRAYRPKTRLQQRAYRLTELYGMTLQDFDRLLEAQGGRCGVCKTDTPASKKGWHIDHSHTTGVVRGILCHNCNVGIGHLKDDPERLEAAAEYLRKAAS